ncbi:hypothetical protein MASR2M15_18510 [Anaerolineales bacterium]
MNKPKRTAGVTLLALFFYALGLFSVGYFIHGVTTSKALNLAIDLQEDTGSLILTFLDNFGIIIPVLIFIFFLMMLYLGSRILSKQDVTSASWAAMVLFWLAIGAISFLVLTVFIWLTAQTPSTTISSPPAFPLQTVLFLLAFIVLAFAIRWWLNKNTLRLFPGEETLGSKNARFAWNLMVPTVAILLLIAARPLERTFIGSLTDKRFAGGAEVVTNFVGLENYSKLLSIRFDKTDCLRDDNGACTIRETIVKDSSLEDLPNDDEAIRDVVQRQLDGENIAGVPKLINPLGLEEIQAALDDTSRTMAESLLIINPSLGNTYLKGILDHLNPDIKVNSVDAVTADNISAMTVDEIITKQVVYQNVRDVVSEDYRQNGFTPVIEFDIFGNHLVLSARDATFVRSVYNTIYFTIFAVFFEFIFGMLVAVIVNAKFPGQGIMRAAMLIPWAIPTVVSARLWEVMLRDNMSGVINHMAVSVGLIDSPIAWLANTSYQINSLIMVDVWKTTPFMALLLLAGLQTIPSDIYEAASVDGAGRIRKFFSITLPMLKPTIAVALIFRTLDSLRVYDLFDVLIGRQLQSMSTYNSFILTDNQQFGYASAIGVTIFVLILVFTIIYMRISKVDVE